MLYIAVNSRHLRFKQIALGKVLEQRALFMNIDMAFHCFTFGFCFFSKSLRLCERVCTLIFLLLLGSLDNLLRLTLLLNLSVFCSSPFGLSLFPLLLDTLGGCLFTGFLVFVHPLKLTEVIIVASFAAYWRSNRRSWLNSGGNAKPRACVCNLDFADAWGCCREDFGCLHRRRRNRSGRYFLRLGCGRDGSCSKRKPFTRENVNITWYVNFCGCALASRRLFYWRRLYFFCDGRRCRPIDGGSRDWSLSRGHDRRLPCWDGRYRRLPR